MLRDDTNLDYDTPEVFNSDVRRFEHENQVSSTF